MGRFDDIQSFVRAVGQTADLASTNALLAEAAHELGFDNYGLTHVERVGGRGTLPTYLSNFPDAWLDLITKASIYVHDPVLMASERSAAAFTWHDLPRILPRLTSRQKQYMRDAGRAGLAEGFTVPLRIPGEASGVCTFAANAGRAFPYRSLPAAQYLSCFAFEAVRRLNSAHPKAPEPATAIPRLTGRQLDCVVLVARGTSDWKAGRLLDISPETVRMHVNLAKDRFGVSSRTELVVRALYYGQLSFGDVVRAQAS